MQQSLYLHNPYEFRIGLHQANLILVELSALGNFDDLGFTEEGDTEESPSGHFTDLSNAHAIAKTFSFFSGKLGSVITAFPLDDIDFFGNHMKRGVGGSPGIASLRKDSRRCTHHRPCGPPRVQSTSFRR